jgi:hypothetical protein
MKLAQLAQTFGLREYMWPMGDIGSPQQIQTLGLNLFSFSLMLLPFQDKRG